MCGIHPGSGTEAAAGHQKVKSSARSRPSPLPQHCDPPPSVGPTLCHPPLCYSGCLPSDVLQVCSGDDAEERKIGSDLSCCLKSENKNRPAQPQGRTQLVPTAASAASTAHGPRNRPRATGGHAADEEGGPGPCGLSVSCGHCPNSGGKGASEPLKNNLQRSILRRKRRNSWGSSRS